MTRFYSLAMLLLLAAGATATAQVSGLNRSDFSRHWQVESESPSATVTFTGDTCEITAPKGLTLWRKEQMRGNMTIEYDAMVVDEGRPGDRLSDLNCFWMASDPKAKTVFTRAAERQGVFNNCYALQLYYVGYGGNHNTTTRFRRYDGNTDAAHRPAILREYRDKDHLLKPNHWYHVRLRTMNGRVEYFIDGRQIVAYDDPKPLTQGWFGFRTTASRTRITNFRYAPSQAIDVPLCWIGRTPSVDTPVSFGVPFARGEVKDVSRLSLGVPADVWVNARWQDGSVKWAGLSAVIPGGTNALTLTEGASRRATASSRTGLTIREKGAQLVVSTGKMTCWIPKAGMQLIDSLYRGGVKVADGATLVASTQDKLQADDIRLHHFTSRIDQAQVERSGRVSAVIKVSGRLSDGTRSWLPFTVRLSFFAGSDQIKLVHSFLYDGDQNRDFIRSLGIRFMVPLREALYNRHVAFSTGDGGVWAEPVEPLVGRRLLTRAHNYQVDQMDGKRVPERETFDDAGRKLIDDWAKWDGFRLSQLSDEGFTIRKRATDDRPWIGTYSGRRADGYAFLGDVSGGLAVQLKDFWQSYPSTIEIGGARQPMAQMTVWLWSPESEPMDLRHYDVVAHDLNSSYEDVQEGMSTPYGIGRTSTLFLTACDRYGGKASVAPRDDENRFLPTPQYLHLKRAFGIWSLPDSSTANRKRIEQRLDQYISFYQHAIDENHWYGFWNYGDVMHAYDPVRHEWRYDVGGFAWDNTELASPDWLWYMFLRTGRQDIWRMAEAMTRHNSEVDTYHIGDMAGLGSRHNVSHWGCGAKESRISQAAFNRFYYYLTTDERTGDIMHEVKDADQKLYQIDPMRLAEPREKFPTNAPARLRIGPDWLGYAGNWMTEWERTGNKKYLKKIETGMRSIASLRNGFFTGNLAKGYDPATGRLSYDGDPERLSTNHLMTIMGGFEVMMEMFEMVDVPAFKASWLDFATRYKEMAAKVTHNGFPVRRLLAYAAAASKDPQKTAEAWQDLWGKSDSGSEISKEISVLMPPLVPQKTHEWPRVSTNDAALWSLDAIYMMEVLKDR